MTDPELQKPPEADLSYFKNPQLTKSANRISVDWPGRGFSFNFDSIHENGRGVIAEMELRNESLGRLFWGQVSLSSQSTIEGLLKRLKKTFDKDELIRIELMTEQTVYEVVKEFRIGEPAVQLQESKKEASQFLIDPMVPLGRSSVIFGDGGSGKSYLSLMMAVSVAIGRDLPASIKCRHGNVLILDWETSREDVEERLTKVCRGFMVPVPENIHYRPMARGLADDTENVRREIDRLKTDFLIIDSIAPASGAEPESADSAVRLFNALRYLGATNLIVAHVSKASLENNAIEKPYGSVFVNNLARSSWQVKATQDDLADAINIGMYHRKCNSGKLTKPFGLQLSFDSGVVQLNGYDLSKEPTLMKATSNEYFIHNVLKQSQGVSAQEIAEITNIPVRTVQTRLSELKKKHKAIEISREGKVIIWGIPQL